MVQNNLDPEVAENPQDLVVYGGLGRAARNWDCLDKILETLKDLGNNETLLIQSGKPVGLIETHDQAPRVLIANSNLVPLWANWKHFHELDQKGLMMYGQMTAGSWIYIGTQGIIQGTYETFSEVGRQHFGGNLKGRTIVTGGLGGMGGAQPLAGVFAGACVLAVEVDLKRVEKRRSMGFVDEVCHNLDEAWEKLKFFQKEGPPRSVALVGNMAQVIKEMVDKSYIPDVVTDQTSAHDPLNGYVPHQLSLDEAVDLRKKNPKEYTELSYQSMAQHVGGMLALKKKGAIAFDYGNNIRAMAEKGGLKGAFGFPGFVPAYIRPLFCKGSGPFRFVALSGDPGDIQVLDQALKELFPEKKDLIHWLEMAEKRIAFQGLPARICWLEYGERVKAGLRFNELVAQKKLLAPVVIGRDHLDCGSVASPYRETEGMKDGSDAVSDWPLLNALSNTACGATWVSFHHGGGVGMGYSQHAGQVIVADGSPRASQCLGRVLTADPATGVLRHLDAGYEQARQVARERGVKSLWL